MKNLFDWIVERTPQYKHLKDLYEQVVKKNEILDENVQYLMAQLNKKPEYNIEKEIKKLFYKIRTYVNKFDKKDENVKEIKRLIKEVL